MDSGSGPAGHPGMTLCVPTYEILLSSYAGAMTGDTIYIDGGYHILG
jgi:hypothetical protein